jgi:hypothetical protein
MINEHDIKDLAPGFKDWLEEIESFSSRYERLCETFAEFYAHAHRELMIWLHAAYLRGFMK